MQIMFERRANVTRKGTLEREVKKKVNIQQRRHDIRKCLIEKKSINGKDSKIEMKVKKRYISVRCIELDNT